MERWLQSRLLRPLCLAIAALNLVLAIVPAHAAGTSPADFSDLDGKSLTTVKTETVSRASTADSGKSGGKGGNGKAKGTAGSYDFDPGDGESVIWSDAIPVADYRNAGDFSWNGLTGRNEGEAYAGARATTYGHSRSDAGTFVDAGGTVTAMAGARLQGKTQVLSALGETRARGVLMAGADGGASGFYYCGKKGQELTVSANARVGLWGDGELSHDFKANGKTLGTVQLSGCAGLGLGLGVGFATSMRSDKFGGSFSFKLGPVGAGVAVYVNPEELGRAAEKYLPKPLADALRPVGQTAMHLLEDVYAPAWKAQVDALRWFAGKSWEGNMKLFSAVADRVQSAYAKTAEGFKVFRKLCGDIYGRLPSSMKKAVDTIVTTMTTAARTVTATARRIGSAVVSTAQKVGQAIVSGAQKIGGAIWNGVKGLFGF